MGGGGGVGGGGAAGGVGGGGAGGGVGVGGAGGGAVPAPPPTLAEVMLAKGNWSPANLTETVHRGGMSLTMRRAVIIMRDDGRTAQQISAFRLDAVFPRCGRAGGLAAQLNVTPARALSAYR